MNWIDSTYKWLILIIGFACLSSSGTAAAQQTPFAKLKQKFENGKIFYAHFTHRYIDSYTQDSVANNGVLWVRKNAYKVEGKNQTVVVDGKTSKVYDDQRNRVIISKYDPQDDDFAPSRILNGVDSTYAVQKQEKKSNGYAIVLTSKDPFATFKEIKITLNNRLIPESIYTKDQADNTITTTFSNGAFLSEKKGMFQLEYPKDAKIIDMRK